MRRVLIGGLFCSLVACGGKSDKGAATSEGSKAAAPGAASASMGGGSITGTVKFTGTPPANPTIDMSQEDACKGKYTTPPVDPIVRVTNGSLGDVIVYVKSGLPAGQSFPTRSDTVVIDQRGCLYHQRSLAMQTNQPLEIKNDDPVLHNIKAVPKDNRPFNISQPKEGMKTTRTFTTAEFTVPIECNVHGWMHANVAVFSHPFFAVSGDDGTFTIKGLPPGTYEVEAWHSKLGTKTMQVTVPATGSAPADFTFSATSS